MNKFEIGQRVIALTNPKDSGGQPREKGKIYGVNAIQYCSKCGNQSINIGVESKATHSRCSCGNTQYNEGLQWTMSSEFAPIISNTLEEAIANEEYELAVVLRDELQTI